jgi:hypothetical protein
MAVAEDGTVRRPPPKICSVNSCRTELNIKETKKGRECVDEESKAAKPAGRSCVFSCADLRNCERCDAKGVGRWAKNQC